MFEDIEVTPREIIFSIIILCFMIGIGIFFNQKISEYNSNDDMKYKTSVRVSNKADFDYVLSTQEGRILVQAPFQAVRGVQFREMKGSYLAVDRYREEYKRHEDTYTDSKGHTHTHTYWKWDPAGTDTLEAQRVSVYNKEYPTTKFELPDLKDLSGKTALKPQYQHKDFFGDTSDYYYPYPHVRYSYAALPIKLTGSFQAVADDKGLHGLDGPNMNVITGTLKDLDESHNQGHIGLIVGFWFVWLLFTALVIFLFVSWRNQWLEDKK